MGGGGGGIPQPGTSTMPDIDPSTIQTATWAGAALAALAILAAVIRRRWQGRDAAERERRAHYNDYIAALHDWQDATEHGDASAVAFYARQIAEMREKGWNIP